MIHRTQNRDEFRHLTEAMNELPHCIPSSQWLRDRIRVAGTDGQPRSRLNQCPRTSTPFRPINNLEGLSQFTYWQPGTEEQSTNHTEVGYESMIVQPIIVRPASSPVDTRRVQSGLSSIRMIFTRVPFRDALRLIRMMAEWLGMEREVGPVCPSI
jgi:hypothetical protein